jgi:hypothetical protein
MKIEIQWILLQCICKLEDGNGGCTKAKKECNIENCPMIERDVIKP